MIYNVYIHQGLILFPLARNGWAAQKYFTSEKQPKRISVKQLQILAMCCFIDDCWNEILLCNWVAEQSVRVFKLNYTTQNIWIMLTLHKTTHRKVQLTSLWHGLQVIVCTWHWTLIPGLHHTCWLPFLEQQHANQSWRLFSNRLFAWNAFVIW